MKIISNDGQSYQYSVDKNPYAEMGYSLATMPITEKISSKICLIEAGDISNKELLDEMDEIEIWPVNNMEDMVGKYYDKDGFIYYCIENTLYRFRLQLNYFQELYKSKPK
jgi:hypothetical protein